ncbi:hypothetical protein [Hydrogenophaga pseudoflava]|uniref:Uncharacterized protein n=1 Tax=Hydrogenophaga pseudoflava TaxID=47421 RepID=A0A4P6WZ96_HYDPS|nr:hypothetical protein [Hydrogenophaga pseudoflava]QBM26554.1 hypothetical protein HPF_02600 [Hydrogenophaga pseudoflava]
MNPVSDLLSRIFRGALKLVLVLAAVVFVLSFLLAALVAVLVMSAWSLITGRKPAPVVMFSRMREQSRQYAQGMWPGRAPVGDVVDVDATEVGERPGAESPLQRLR